MATKSTPYEDRSEHTKRGGHKQSVDGVRAIVLHWEGGLGCYEFGFETEKRLSSRPCSRLWYPRKSRSPTEMEAESTVATPSALASTVNVLDRWVDPQHLRSMAHQYTSSPAPMRASVTSALSSRMLNTRVSAAEGAL